MTASMIYPRRRRDSYEEIVEDMPPNFESPIRIVGRKRGL
jgi:hypothetical protein